jgi:iron complex outermembrane receptor protein
MNVKLLRFKAALCCAVVLPTLLIADRALAAAAAGPELEEVVVTAQKREESLQNAAISVLALKSDLIENLGVKNVNDLQAQMPGVQFMSSGLTNTTIRGVGTYNNQPNVDAAVAWNVDGTYISHHMATPAILFDLERVEVVRGPQGTLYGRNSNGGSINIITGTPKLGEFHSRASLASGNYNQLNADLMVNIPINDTMAIRAAFANDYRHGYYDDGGEAKNNYAARVRLLFQPSERVDVIGTVEWQDVDGSNVGLSYCPPFARQQRPACQTVEWKPYQGFGLPGNYNLYGTAGPIGDNPGFTQRTNVSAYVQWDYKGDIATLTSITNWHHYNREELHVWDFSSYSPKHLNTFVTQEFRLTGAPGSRVDWVGGVFYSLETSSAVERFGTQLAPDYQVFQAASSYGVERGQVTSAAVFGEAGIPVTDRLTLRGGLRFTYEKKDLPGTARALLNTPNPIIVQTGDVLKTNKVTWLIGAEYHFTPDNMIYVKANTGFKSGTVNAVPSYVGVPTTTTPEEITAYEIGSKNRFLNNRVEINVEAFHYDYKGYQVVVIATDPTGFFPGVFFPSANAQKARFDGGEIESHFLVFDRGQLDLSVSLLDAVHTKFVTRAFDFSGHKVERSPPYTITAAYTHTFPLANGGSISARISSMLVDGAYTKDSNLPGDWQASYTNTSLNIGYRTPDNHWSLTGWVRNLEDKAVMTVSQGAVGRPGWNVFMFPPRLWGFTLKYEN